MHTPPVDDADDRDLSVGEPARVAAGWRAVGEALEMGRAQMGVRRTIATLRAVNQVDGFDCPGCAWPEPAHRSHAEFCENGAKAVAEEATLRRVRRDFFAAHSIADLGARSDYWLGQQGRLTEPMVKRSGRDHYEAISWDEALDLVAGALRALPSPHRAVFYTSGRTSNEAAFVYQLFARRFGTNNLPDCSNLCHESSGVALTQTIGVGKGSVTLEDFAAADLIFVVGQNPGTNHPRMLTALEDAKRAGASIVAVNPLPEAGLLRFKNPQRASGLAGRGTQLADLFLQVRVNGDLALFQAINRSLVERADRDATVLDRAFLDRYCEGFEALASHLRGLDRAETARATGLPGDAIERAVDMVVASDRIIVCWAMGLTQHKNAVATIQEIVNFALLRGNIGRRGAGLCPVRGHSNVQGDRTMGIHERPTRAFLDALAAEFAFEPPRAAGHDVVESINAMAAGAVDVFLAVGGNFVAAAPDTVATAAAMRRCQLTAHVATKLNRSHTVCGDTALILPCLGRTELDATDRGEQVVTVEDSMGVVHASRGRLAPASPELRSEVAILCALAERTVDPLPGVHWEAWASDYDAIRDRIARVVAGFEDFNRRVRRPGGFTLPHPPRDERRFPTPTGKAQLTVNALDIVETPAGHLLLQTVRSHDQYNTTIYGLDDRYRGIRNGRRVVFVHADDLAALGFGDGDTVDIVGPAGADGVHRRASGFRLVAYPVARGTCAAYFPEANAVVPLDSTADGSNTPTSKSVVVRFEAA